MQKSAVVGLLVLGGSSCICIALIFLLKDRKNKTQDASVKLDIQNDHDIHKIDLKTEKSETIADTHGNEINLDDLTPNEDDSSCCSSDSFTSCTSTCSGHCTPSTNSSSSGASDRHDNKREDLINNRSITNLQSNGNTPTHKSLYSHLNSPVILAYKETLTLLPDPGMESPEMEVVQCFESNTSSRYSSEVITYYNGYHDIIMPNSPQTGVLINFTPKPAKNL